MSRAQLNRRMALIGCGILGTDQFSSCVRMLHLATATSEEACVRMPIAVPRAAYIRR